MVLREYLIIFQMETILVMNDYLHFYGRIFNDLFFSFSFFREVNEGDK